MFDDETCEGLANIEEMLGEDRAIEAMITVYDSAMIEETGDGLSAAAVLHIERRLRTCPLID